MDFAEVFMGHVGFDELKKHCRLGDEFGREVLAVMSERATCEMAYAKSLKRLGQRLSKACANLPGSPLTTLWRTIYSEMEVDADAHRKFSTDISEQCVKAPAPILESISKARRNLEVKVENAAKVLSDSSLDHSKCKKRHHQLSKEKEAINDQLESARPRTKNDESKLSVKLSKTEVLLSRADDEYYESLISLQRKQTDWEVASRDVCGKVQELERNKTDRLCRIAMSYSTLLRDVSVQFSTSCDQIGKYSNSLDPDGELRIVVQSKKTLKYQTELILCDYYGENFSNTVKAERRLSSLSRQLDKFLGDFQKEQTHYEGMQRLVSAQNAHANEVERLELQQKLEGIKLMMTFLDVNRAKLRKAIGTINGDQIQPHPLAGSMQQHYDKQGIVYTTLRIPTAQSPLEEEVLPSPSFHEQSPITNQSRIFQRSQSERGQTFDDINVGRKEPRSKSFQNRGTLTAKQLQSLSYGLGLGRKQAPVPPAQNYTQPKSTCVAKYRYDSREHDELTIEEGDVISIIEKIDNDWWKGELNGNTGIFPATYVDVL